MLPCDRIKRLFNIFKRRLVGDDDALVLVLSICISRIAARELCLWPRHQEAVGIGQLSGNLVVWDPRGLRNRLGIQEIYISYGTIIQYCTVYSLDIAFL